MIKKELKKNDNAPQYLIDLATCMHQIPQVEKAKEQYEKALKDLNTNEVAVRNMANAFDAYRLYDYVIAVYDKAGKAFRAQRIVFQLWIGADVYQEKRCGECRKAYYLINMEANPQNVQLIKTPYKHPGIFLSF